MEVSRPAARAIFFCERFTECEPWARFSLEPFNEPDSSTSSSTNAGVAPDQSDVAAPLSEDAPIRPLRSPDQPTLEERLAHEVSHFPYRAWCRHCVAGRGLAQPFVRGVDRSQDAIPLISFDYCYMGDEVRLPDNTLVSFPNFRLY